MCSFSSYPSTLRSGPTQHPHPSHNRSAVRGAWPHPRHNEFRSQEQQCLFVRASCLLRPDSSQRSISTSTLSWFIALIPSTTATSAQSALHKRLAHLAGLQRLEDELTGGHVLVVVLQALTEVLLVNIARVRPCRLVCRGWLWTGAHEYPRGTDHNTTSVERPTYFDTRGILR